MDCSQAAKRVLHVLTVSPQQRVLLLSRNVSRCTTRCTRCTSLARGKVSLNVVGRILVFFRRNTLAAPAAPDPVECQRFLQLKLDVPSALAYPFFGRNRRPYVFSLVVKSEERVVAVVERPDSRIWDRHGGDGLQLGADDIVTEVVELRINS